MEIGNCSHSYATLCSQFVVSLYNSGFQMWSCAVMAISCCNTVPVAPALPSRGPGLCAVPARGALAILRGHSGSALQLGVFDGGLGGVLVAVGCSIEVGWVKWRVGC